MTGLRIVASNYSQDDRNISLAGCYSFAIKNMGAVTAILFGTIEIPPGDTFPFFNAAEYPYAENTRLEWGLEPGIKKIQVIKTVKVEFENCDAQ